MQFQPLLQFLKIRRVKRVTHIRHMVHVILAEELIPIAVVIDADIVAPRKIHIVNDEEGPVRQLCRRRWTDKKLEALKLLRKRGAIRPRLDALTHGQ